MNPCSFTFVETDSGMSSGGGYASGEYCRDDRRLEIHFRYSLGQVRYHIGHVSASHESYMKEILGGNGGNHYPGFSTDPLDGFRHLAHDIEVYGQDFLNGSGVVLEKAALKENQEAHINDTIKWAATIGDNIKREEARLCFQQRDYQGVVEKLKDIKYPELMTEFERKMLELAKKRIK